MEPTILPFPTDAEIEAFRNNILGQTITDVRFNPEFYRWEIFFGNGKRIAYQKLD